MSSSMEKNLKKLTKPQKAALLLIALGQKWATEAMRHLKADEVQSVSYWINQTQYVPQAITEHVIREFYESLIQKTSLSSIGGKDYLIDVLRGLMGEDKAQEIIDNLMEKDSEGTFKILRRVDPKQVALYLKNEQPQTIALMLAYLEPGRASQIVAALSEEVQAEVIYRLARLEEIDPDVVSHIEESLSDSLGSLASKKVAQKTGGPKAVADILNELDRNLGKDIIDAVSEADYDLASSIKDLMFVFEDIILLDDKSMQTLLKEIDQSDLIISLKGTSDAIKDKVFANLSKRQAETITEELSFLGPMKSSVIHQAHQKIISVIRKLDEEGMILIQGKGGGDDEIVQ